MHRFARVVSIGAVLSSLVLNGVGCKPDVGGEERAGMSHSRLQEATFGVDGMTCASCNVTVKVAAEKVPGVHSARADSIRGRAWVTFDPATTTPVQIATAISATGYRAAPLANADGEGHEPATNARSAAAPSVSDEVACRILRDGVYRLWPELGRAPRPREIALALTLSEGDVERALEALSSKEFPCGRIERAQHSDRIVFAWPFSNVPTEYVVKIQNSKPIFARCAIDALGVSAMFGKPVEIEATSISSDVPIRIAVNGSRIERAEPAEAVVWVAGEDGSCDEMVFVANRAELDEWRRRHEKPEGNTLTLDEATAYGVSAFGGRLRTN
jgi:mercuric ion binding protein